MRAIQFVQVDGAVISGADAFPHILRRMHGWRWAGWLMSLPGMRWLARPAYALVARNRMTLSALIGRTKSDCSDNECRR